MTRFDEEKLLGIATDAHKAARWSVPEDFLTKEHYLRVVDKLEWKSSPGYPYCVRNPTNKDLFKVNESGVPDPSRVDEMWDIVNHRIAALLRGERTADPIRLFVKPEPLKEKKLRDSKFRLIASVSVVDQIIDHMLFDDMNETMYAQWDMVPSKVGWSPYVGGWKCMPRKKWLAIDKTSWDWTVHLWLIDLVFKVRQRLCRNMNSTWKRLAEMRYRMLYIDALFVTSAGVVLRQKYPGVMKSGCVNTIADNSIMQFLLHIRVCLEIGEAIGVVMAMGDDTLQEKPKDLKKYLETLGQYCIVKKADEGNEFAGMLFAGMRVEPLYAGKHAFSILHAKKEVLPDVAAAYSLLYHRSQYRQWFRRMFTESGFEIPTIGELDAIYDGGE